MSNDWKFCPMCGSDISNCCVGDGEKYTCIDCNCANYAPSKPEFEVGDFVAHEFSHKLYMVIEEEYEVYPGCIAKQKRYKRIFDGKVVIYGDVHFTPITIGSKFKTMCDKDVFSEGVGEFVVIDVESIPFDWYTMGADGYISNEFAKNSQKGGTWYPVLPSIDSRWWDRQIGDTGVWVRAYEGDKYPLVYIDQPCFDTWFHWNNPKGQSQSFIGRLIYAINPPIIPEQLRQLEYNSEYKAPEGRK